MLLWVTYSSASGYPQNKFRLIPAFFSRLKTLPEVVNKMADREKDERSFLKVVSQNLRDEGYTLATAKLTAAMSGVVGYEKLADELFGWLEGRFSVLLMARYGLATLLERVEDWGSFDNTELLEIFLDEINRLHPRPAMLEFLQSTYEELEEKVFEACKREKGPDMKIPSSVEEKMIRGLYRAVSMRDITVLRLCCTMFDVDTELSGSARIVLAAIGFNYKDIAMKFLDSLSDLDDRLYIFKEGLLSEHAKMAEIIVDNLKSYLPVDRITGPQPKWQIGYDRNFYNDPRLRANPKMAEVLYRHYALTLDQLAEMAEEFVGVDYYDFYR